MLFDWAISTTILLSIVLGAFVASFLLDNVFTFRSNRTPSDDPIQEAFHLAKEDRALVRKRMYQQIAITYLMQIVNSVITIVTFVFEVPSVLTHAFRVLLQNRQQIVLISFTALVAFGLFENGPLLLEKFDGLYSCAITPFVNNIVFSALHILNLFWVVIVPYYNMTVTLIRQVVAGTFLIATKCATSSLSIASFAKGSVEYFVAIFESIMDFTGITAENFAENNMFFNTFNVYTINSKFRNLFRFIPETFTCFCKATSDFSDLLFYGFIESDRMDWVLHHLVNIPISFAQTFLRIVPPFLEYPSFNETFYHAVNAFWELCKLYDEWIFEAIHTIFNTTNFDGGIVIDTPKVFFFEATSHLFGAFANLAHTTIDGISHVVLPFDTTPITNTQYMAGLFKLDEVFTHIGLFVHSIAHITTWAARVLIEILVSAIWMSRCQFLEDYGATVEGSCVNYIDGQCSVSCLATNKIRIHDVNINCLFRPDAKNRYNHQKNIFESIRDEAAEAVDRNGFVSMTKYLPLDDKNIIFEARAEQERVFLKISYPDIVLQEQTLVDFCLLNKLSSALPPTECYKNTFETALQDAYGARATESVYTAVGCTIESASLAPLNTIQLLHSFSVDYFWFNFVNYFRDDQSTAGNRIEKMQKNGLEFRALLRAYSGVWFGRDYEPPCKVYYNFTKSKHFSSSKEYAAFLEKNNDKCKQVNLNEHVFYHMDRLGYFLLANVFQRETLGKFLFNLYRLFIEQLRILIRLEAEGYGFYIQDESIFADGKIVSSQMTNTIMRRELGCLYDYGNTTHTIRGYCSNFTFAQDAVECDLYDNSLNVSTECGCIENPNIDGTNFQTVAELNTRFYTTRAISKWCGVNLWDFNYIFLARAVNGIRNFITALSPQNLEQGFPPIENICDTENYQYMQSTTIETIFDNTCTVLAYKDFFCPTGELLQRVYLTFGRFLRKEQRNFLRFFDARFTEVDMTIHDQVCDAQNALMALSNMVSSLFLRDERIQKPFTRLIFSVLNIISIPLEFSILGLRSVRAFVAGDASILDTGESDGLKGLDISKVRNVVMKSISIFISLFSKHIIDLCESFSGFLNTIVPCNGSVCAGSIFDIIALIVGIVETITRDVALATLLDFIELVARGIQILVTPGDLGEDEYIALIEKMITSVTSIIEILASNASLWLSFLFDTLLGPIGDIIKAVQSAICSVLQVDFIKSLLSIDTSFCSGVSTTAPSSSSSGGGGDVGNFFSGIFGRRRLLSNSSILFDAATKINWDGTTRCDQLMLAYRDYDLEKMSPLEKIDWGQCLYYRLSVDIVEKKYNIGLPHDLLYNWVRKFTVIFDASIASYLYFSWWLDDSKSRKDLKIILENHGYNPQRVINAVTLGYKLMNDFASWKNLKKALEKALNTENDKKGERVYSNLRQFHKHIYQTDWTASVLESRKALHKFYTQHVEMTTSINVSNVQIFSDNIKSIFKVYDEVDANVFGSMYGAFTNLQCPKDSILCLNCAFVDNFLYNALYQFQDAAHFYRHDVVEVVLPEFGQYWNDTSQYNARYTKAFTRAQSTNAQNYGGTLKTTQSFGDFFSGLFNGTYSTGDIINGISYFLQGNYTGQIPQDATIVFANDLQYYIELPFQQSCDTAKWKYNSYKEEVGNGLLTVLLVIIVTEAFMFLLGTYNVVLNIMIYAFVGLLNQFLYMFVTYGYNPTCYPIMPAYFVYDFLNWVDENVFLECACSYVPYLSVEACAQQTCDTCNITTTFHDCRDVLPAFKDLGYAYHFVFLFRWLFPEQFKYLGNLKSWPFPYIFSNDGFSKLLSDVERNLSVSGTEENCFFLHILTPISIIVISYLIVLMTIPLISIAVRGVKESLSMFINTVLVLYYLSQASNS